MKKNFVIKYLFEEKLFEEKLDNNTENNHFTAHLLKNNDTTTLTIVPKKPFVIKELFCEYDYNFNSSLVYLNGYQSWTDSKELSEKDKMTGLLKRPKALVKKFALDGYGDYGFTEYKNKKGFFHGFSYGYIRNGEEYYLIGSLNEKTGFTVLYFDLKAGKIKLVKDCRDLEVFESYNAFEFVELNGSKDFVFDSYFNLMKIQKPTAKKITGYTSWYNHYQNISEKIILENLAAIKNGAFKYDIFQIDDGFEQFVGDWLKIDLKKFPNGLEKIAKEINNSNMTAGIWLAPFVCELKSDIYKNHPDWIVKKQDGTPFLCGNNWSYFAALDFYNSHVRQYIKDVFDYYKKIGFNFFKLDFLYGVCAMPRKDKTRGQICCEAMEFLRECAGEAVLLGCGVPLAPCFGKFEYMRIGCDVSLDWNNTPIMRLLHRERTGTKSALLNTIYRSHLDGRAFLNDPDVFLLRDNIKLNSQQKDILIKLNSLFGSVLFTSDNLSDYSEENQKLLNNALMLSCAKDIKLSGNGKIVEISYNLNGKANSLKIDFNAGKYIN